MVVDGDKLLLTLLERVTQIEATVSAAFELQGTENKAHTNMLMQMAQFNLTLTWELSRMIADFSDRKFNVELPEIVIGDYAEKYQETYDRHYERVHGEIMEELKVGDDTVGEIPDDFIQ